VYASYKEPTVRRELETSIEAQGPMLARFGKATHSFTYDPERYGFHRIVAERLCDRGFLPADGDLTRLHEANDLELLSVDTSGQSAVSSSLFELGPVFEERYQTFLKEVVRVFVGFNFYFQRFPTFRCSVPGSPGYTWRPNFHTDIALGHPPDEINFWVPVTLCAGNNSLIYADLKESMEIWRAYDFDFARYHEALDRDDALMAKCESISRSFDADNGIGLAFDSRCMHLHQRNNTNSSRVSFDFRILPVDAYERMGVVYQGTGRRKSEFRPGDYYHEKSLDAL
jgi:hypothetical protein